MQQIQIAFDIAPFAVGDRHITEVLPLYAYSVELQCTPSTDNNVVLHTGFLTDATVLLKNDGAGHGEWIRCVASLPLHEFVHAMDTLLSTYALNQLRLVVLLNVNKHANTGAGTGLKAESKASAATLASPSAADMTTGATAESRSSHTRGHIGSNNILSNDAVMRLVQNVQVKSFVIASTTVNAGGDTADPKYPGPNGSPIASNAANAQLQNSTLGLLSSNCSNIHSYGHILLPDEHVLSHSLLYYGGLDTCSAATSQNCSHVLAAVRPNITSSGGSAVSATTSTVSQLGKTKLSVRWYMRLAADDIESIPQDVQYSYQLSVYRPCISAIGIHPIDAATISLVGNPNNSGEDGSIHVETLEGLSQWREIVVGVPSWVAANDVILLSNHTYQCVYGAHVAGYSVGSETLSTRLEMKDFGYTLTKADENDISFVGKEQISSVLVSAMEAFSCSGSYGKENKKHTGQYATLPANLMHNSPIY